MSSDEAKVKAQEANASMPPESSPAQESGDEQEGKTADDELAAMFGGMKKKKKSKKVAKNFTVNLDTLPPSKEDGTEDGKEETRDAPKDTEASENSPKPDADAAPAASAPGADDLFGDLKKKKKKSKKDKLAELDKALAETGGTDQGEGDEFDENPEVNPFADDPAKEREFLLSEDKYPYAWLLSRTFATLREHNPALSGDKKKYTMVPPVVEREGSKKTAFVNCADICRRMHRDHEHVQAFLFAELGTIGNEDGAGRLIIKGRFQQQQIQNVLRKYISEYVQCKTCKSADTELSRENRIYFVKCKTCGSQRSVAAIKTGFQAITGKRSRLRAAA